jgi:hypothetical protein
MPTAERHGVGSADAPSIREQLVAAARASWMASTASCIPDPPTFALTTRSILRPPPARVSIRARGTSSVEPDANAVSTPSPCNTPEQKRPDETLPWVLSYAERPIYPFALKNRAT